MYVYWLMLDLNNPNYILLGVLIRMEIAYVISYDIIIGSLFFGVLVLVLTPVKEARCLSLGPPVSNSVSWDLRDKGISSN